MIIKVHKGPQWFDINTNTFLPFTELIQIIQQKYGPIPNIAQNITYKHSNKTVFVLSDSTLELARSLFQNELHLIIVDKQKIVEDELHAKSHYKCYKQIQVVDQNWDKDKWIEDICNSRQSAKININKIPTQYRTQQINQKVIEQIQAYEDKVDRYGHSQGLVGSFLMSCYHQQARKKNISEKQIRKCIWKLDRWRQERQKVLSSQLKEPVQAVPILLLPKEKKIKFKSNPDYSYLFPSARPAVIMDPQFEPKAMSLQSSPEDDTNYIRYYLFDQIHLQLSKFSAGQAEKEQRKKQLNNFISKLPFNRQFTDTDLNFVTTVFQAFVLYAEKGNIYRAPPTPQSQLGVLLQFDDNQSVAILGDWGTGEVDANSLLQEVVIKENASIILHLGDVYYAGFPEEFRRISQKIHQLQLKRPNLRYYAIPGNHDYYTFGGPFYQHLQNNNQKKEFNQTESFFCLRNKSHTVQFIGLNTATNQHSIDNPVNFLFEGTFIHENEVKWAINKINNFPGKTILLTHHMLFSAFQSILGSLSQFGMKNPQLNNQLAFQLFQVFPKLTCWIWGHEHRFSTYITNSYGINRCILFGNSAFQNNEEDYYKVKYPADNITDTKYHPQKSEQGYYHHTAIVLKNFLTDKIDADYIYLTSSYNKIPKRVKKLTDILAAPQQKQIVYKDTFQMIEQSGLSLSYSGNIIWLGSAPANLRILNAQNPKAQGTVDLSKNVLINIQNTQRYLYYGIFGFVDHGDYSSESVDEKKKYLWKINRQKNSKTSLQTGDIFRLQNVYKKKQIGRQQHLSLMRLSATQISSRFFLYLRQTTHTVPLKSPPNKSVWSCCNLM